MRTLVAVGVMLGARSAHAVVIASDNASDPAYADGWTIGDNGGTGFQPWAGLAYGRMEIDAAPAESDNDLSAPAFRAGTGGFVGFNGYYELKRPLVAPMQAGQTFKVDYDSYAIGVPSEPRDIGIIFRSADGERFALYGYYYDNEGGVTFGSDFWGVNALTANDNLAGGAPLPTDPLSGIVFRSTATTTDSSDGMSFIFDLTTIDAYRVRIIDDNVTKLDVSGQLKSQTSGGTSLVGQAITEIRFYGSETFYDPTQELSGNIYFNNLLVETTSTGAPGDFDLDQDVDGVDFLKWQRGESPSPLSDQDYSAWKSGFGTPATPMAATIPEPAALVLGLAAGAIFTIRRRARVR
jgi:hypothetical protein